MGYQVLRQPDGQLAIFCSNTNTFVMWNATADDVIGQFVEKATDRARSDAERVIGLVEAANAHEAYFQFAMTWDEAVAEDREHGGELSAELDGILDPPAIADGDSAVAGALHAEALWSAGKTPVDPALVGYSAIEGFDPPEEEQ